MSIFSSYVTTVGSTTVPLIEDTPDVIKQSVLGSVVGGTNIASDLVKTISNTYSHDVRRAYEYARTKYYYGLPEGSVGRFVVDNSLIKSVLMQFTQLGVNEDIAIVSANLDNLSYHNYGYEYLRINEPMFDSETKILGSVTFERYLNSEGNETSDEGVSYSGNAYTDGLIDPISDTSFWLRLYTYEQRGDPNNSENIIRTWVKWIQITVVNPDYNKLYYSLDEYYYYVEYYIFDKTTGVHKDRNHIWNYWVGSGRFTELTVTKETASQNFYMPVVPIRINNKMLTGEDSYHTTRYKTSKELLNILGLKIDDLHEGILENPDVKDIDHAYVVLGANLFSDKPETIRYLHEFLLYLYGATTGSKLTITDETYETVYTWESIIAERKYGSIGKVGSVTKEISVRKDKWDTTPNYFRTRKQMTTDTYLEITWNEPALHNYIYNTGKGVTTALDAINKDSSEAFIIPLNISIVNTKLTSIQANTLYYDSLKLVLNAYDRKKLKWYQTGLFRGFVMVISVAISLFSGGLGMAFFGMVFGAALNLIISMVYKLLIAVFGEDIAGYVAGVIAVVAIYYGYTSGFIADIGQVISIAIQSSSMILEQIIGVQMEEITSNMAEFQEYAKEQMEHLEVVQSELNGKQQVDPLNIFGSVGMIPNQSIDQYYYSKLQLPLDYGTSAYDMLSHWVDSQLTLPHLTR